MRFENKRLHCRQAVKWKKTKKDTVRFSFQFRVFWRSRQVEYNQLSISRFPDNDFV